MKTAVVIPSRRGPKCLESFIEIAPSNVDFIIISESKLEKKLKYNKEINNKLEGFNDFGKSKNQLKLSCMQFGLYLKKMIQNISQI